MNKQYINGSIIKTVSYFYTVLFILGVVFLLTSCAPTKNSYYFKTLQKDTTISGLVNKDIESKISKGDNLAIVISSLSRDEDLLFNLVTSTGVAANAPGFMVDNDGSVTIHKLGKVKAEGLTRKELAGVLQKQLLPFLKDPIVTVQYLNHKITVLGEVQRPQVINMPEEQLSLIDVLVLSGDVKEDSKRNDIMIIRETGNEKKVKHINLEDHSIFTSPWYYVQPNDIVIVSPNFEKRDKEARRTRLQTNVSIIVSTVSLLLIVINRLFP